MAQEEHTQPFPGKSSAHRQATTDRIAQTLNSLDVLLPCSSSPSESPALSLAPEFKTLFPERP